jgi:hypothetical protein
MIDDLKAEARVVRMQIRLCQTNPNLGTLGYLGNETRDAEQMRQTNPISAQQDVPPFHYAIIPPFQPDGDYAKQSQFRQRVERVKCLAGNELWWIGHARDFGETKPIEKKLEV